MSAATPPGVVADLCAVTIDGDSVTLCFGQRIDAADQPGAQAAHLLRRIAMPTGGAAKLQDLLLAVLQAPLAMPDRER